MTAAAVTRLIDLARADGVELVAAGDKVKLRGPAESVERWRQTLAARKAEVLAALAASDAAIPADLERLIQRAGTFYGYSADDWQLILQAARHDPEGLRRVLLADPLAPYHQTETQTERTPLIPSSWSTPC